MLWTSGAQNIVNKRYMKCTFCLGSKIQPSKDYNDMCLYVRLRIETYKIIYRVSSRVALDFRLCNHYKNDYYSLHSKNIFNKQCYPLPDMDVQWSWCCLFPPLWSLPFHPLHTVTSDRRSQMHGSHDLLPHRKTA